MQKAQLEQLLLQRLEPNTERVKQAVEILTKYAKQDASMSLLFEVMATCPDASVRQLAAIYLRKSVSKQWIKHNAEQQENYKALLLQRVVLESDRRVRGSVAEVASAIAKFLVPADQWPGLLQFLEQSAASANADHREVAMMMFEKLIEHVGDTLRQHFTQFSVLFGTGLNDPESLAVQVAALKALGMLVPYLHSIDELNLAAQHMPVIMGILLRAIESLGGCDDDTGVLIATFELLDDLLENPAPALAPHLNSILPALLKIAGARELDRAVRERAINFFYFASLRKPKMLAKAKAIPTIAEVLLQVLCEPEDKDETETSTHELAGQALNMMCLHMANKHIFPIIAQFVTQAIGHQDPMVRKAAVSALLIASEGCHEPLRANLGSVVPQVVQCGLDPHDEVREAVCITIGQFAENLQPEICDHYQQLLPALFSMLQADVGGNVQEKACYALHAFCEFLEEKILPYLAELLTQLVLITKNHQKREVQEMAVAAISSVVAAAKEKITPYAEDILEVMKVLMTQTEDAYLKLRARATETVGVLAVMLGRQHFEPIAQQFMDMALQGMQSEYPELREYTYGFFANMAEIFGPDFASMLETVIPFALVSLNNEDSFDAGDGDEEDVDSEDEDEDDTTRRVTVRTDLLDEKASAAAMIGNVAIAVGPAFAPYVDGCMEAMEKASNYIHPDVRSNVHESMASMMQCIYKTINPPKWTPGLAQFVGVHTTPVLPVEVRRHANTCLLSWLNALACEADRETVAKAAEAMASTLETFGPEVIATNADDLCSELVNLLKDKAPCQTGEDSDDEDTLGGEEDHDEVLMEVVMDLVVAFAKVAGAEFAPAFEHMFKPIIKFTRPANDAKDRMMSVGCIAEVIKALGTEAAVAPFLERTMQIATPALADADHEVRRNSVFCVGVVCSTAPTAMAAHYAEILQKIAPLFNDAQAEVVDNSCGAVARMIKAAPQAVPLAQVLPAFLGALPLKEDLEEVPAICETIVMLLEMGDGSVLAPHLQKVAEVLMASLIVEPAQLEGQLQLKVVQAVQMIANADPSAAAALNGFAPEDRAKLEASLSPTR